MASFKKIRPDSVIGSLDPDVKAEVDEMLLTGSTYKKIQEVLADGGIALSQTSIAQYYQTHLLPSKIAMQNATAKELAMLDTDGLDGATISAIKSAVFDLAGRPNCDAKKLTSLFSMVLKAEQLKQDDRRIKLLEDKAAKYDLLQAELQKKDIREGIDPAVLAEIEQKIKLL